MRREAALGKRTAPIVVAAVIAAGLLVLHAAAAPSSVSPSTSTSSILRVAVISDLNGSYGSTAYEASVTDAVQQIVAMHPDLVISTGDMVAGQRIPHLSAGEIDGMWASFHRHVSDPLAAAGIPLAVTPGNHDGSAYRGFQAERQAYGQQWQARRPAVEFVDDAEYPYRYAFAVDGVLFVSLDATTVGPLGGAQKAWLRGVLARANGRYRHRVAFGHLPLWPLASGRETESVGDDELEKILEEGGVELMLSGHHHAFYPGQRGGLVQVGQSCLGAGPRRLMGGTERSQRGFSLIEFTDAGISAAAFVGPGLETPVDWSSLPGSVGTGRYRVTRADRAGSILTPTPTKIRSTGSH